MRVRIVVLLIVCVLWVSCAEGTKKRGKRGDDLIIVYYIFVIENLHNYITFFIYH